MWLLFITSNNLQADKCSRVSRPRDPDMQKGPPTPHTLKRKTLKETHETTKFLYIVL